MGVLVDGRLMMLEEPLDEAGVALLCCEHEGALAVVVGLVDLRPSLEEGLAHVRVSLECRVVQGRPARVVPVLLVQACCGTCNVFVLNSI